MSEHVHFLQDLDGFGMEGMEMEHGRTPLEAPWYGYIMLLYNYIILYLSSQEVRLGYDDYRVSCKACTFSDSGHGSDGVCTVIPMMLVHSHPVSFHRRTVEPSKREAVEA